MKVALITDGIWPNIIGGIQRHSFYLCKYLAQSGVKVDLYHTAKNKEHIKDIAELFTKEELVNISSFLITYPKGMYFPGHYLRDSYNYSKNIFNILQPEYASYDIIYIQGFSGWYLLKHRLKNLPLQPVFVINLHGLEVFQRPSSLRNSLEHYMFRPFAKKQLRRADYVQSLGGKLTQIIRSIGIPGQKIIVTGIAVEGKWLRDIPVEGNRKTFVFVGRYEERKGIAVLNSALQILISEARNFTFHFVGPIPREHQIVHKNVVYHGLAENNDAIISVLDQSDFLVVPSYSEGMPTVILEGMARGCGIIASDVGATQELVSSENGYLLEPGNSKVLYNALKSALDLDESSIRNIKNASIAKVKEKYTWEKLVVQMVSRFKYILEKGSNGQAI